MNSKLKPFSLFSFLTELYLVIPAALWMLGWTQLWFALPVVIGLVYVLYCHYKDMRKAEGEEGIRISGVSFFVYGLIGFIAVFLCGFDGRVMQSWDLIVRNPIYSELIAADWPLVMPDGRAVMYALMFWLPPALVSKWLPGAEVFLLQVWCFVGVMLMLLNLHGTLGLKKTALMVLAISIFTPLSGMVDDVLNVIFHKNAVMGVHFRLPSAGTQWTNTFHYFIVAGLYLTLVTERRLPLGVYIMVSALFACLHPILASVVFPLVVYNVWQRIGGWREIYRLIRMPEVILGCVLVAIFMLYYSSGGACWWAFTLDAPYAPKTAPWLVYALGITLAIIPPLLVWWSTRQKIMLVWAVWCPVIITCWYGETNGVNEWMYKFTVLYSFYIIYYLVRHIGEWQSRCVLGCLLFFSLFSFMRMVDRSGIIGCAMSGFPVKEVNFMNEWGGQFYHPESSIYRNMTAEREALPAIFR